MGLGYPIERHSTGGKTGDDTMKKPLAEFIGTFALVFFGCGSAIFMGQEIGMLGVSFAFGLAVIAMAYSMGHISGAHLNPAVSVGALVAGQLSKVDFARYVAAQIIGGITAALVLYVIAQGKTGGYDTSANGFAANGWSDYSWFSVFVFEFVATLLFVMVILAATQDGVTSGVEGIVIGLTLVVIHLTGIAISGTSVNPARSIGPALFAGAGAMGQLWLFLLAPTLGGIAAGFLHKSGITSASGEIQPTVPEKS